MAKKKGKKQAEDNLVAPGIDKEDEFGRQATEANIANGESTKVTRFVYNEYDPSEE